jgi:acetyl-CoA carboxylase biotin carboxylase subunit
MRRALHELRVVGVETSREFHLRVMEDEAFRRGDISIQWLEQRLPALVGSAPPAAERRRAAVAAALLADRDRGVAHRPAGAPSTGSVDDRWRAAARRDALR